MGLQSKTLVVGGAGFLGNSLVEILSANGHTVVVADSDRRISRYAIQRPGVEYVTIDWPVVSLGSVISSVSNVVHLAWSSNPASSMKDVESDAAVNIIGTVRLLEELVGIEKFGSMCKCTQQEGSIRM